MSICVSRPASLQQLQRRFDRLRQLQNRLCLPAAGHIDVCGRRYCLPLSAEHARPCKQVPPRVLNYLAGFFDGDGCVTVCRSSIRLQVSQTESNGAVLFLFRNIFGGSITREHHARGLRRPSVQWFVTGGTCRQASALLSTGTSCKRSQLAIASLWPQERSLRAEAAGRLKLLKQQAHEEASCPSWQYLAGFFDAEGCITVGPRVCVRLAIKQKFPPVLHAIQSFLAHNGIGCEVYETHGELVVSVTEASKRLLAKLLRSGLRVKREAARLALQTCSGNLVKVRSDLHEMVGNQGRYRRLSTDGLDRGNEIRRIQDRLRYRYLKGKHHSQLESQLLVLQEDHKLKCAQERLLQIRFDIRSFISQGATQLVFAK
ncbi:USP [Symbiodinium sp. CCMP2592]|nr:USP [Symbiodinium sp. CCMP2592]